MKQVCKQYLPPTLYFIEITIEKGFSASLEDPKIDPEQNW